MMSVFTINIEFSCLCDSLLLVLAFTGSPFQVVFKSKSAKQQLSPVAVCQSTVQITLHPNQETK